MNERIYTIVEYHRRYGWPFPDRWYVFGEDGSWYTWTGSLQGALTLVRFLLTLPETPAG